LPLLKGAESNFSRKGLIHHSVSGHFAYREGDHKLVLAAGSGGWTSPKESEATKRGLPKAQLYNLKSDPGEKENLYEAQPEVAEQLLSQLTEYVNSGASVAGKESKNDINKIVLWKTKKKLKKKSK